MATLLTAFVTPWAWDFDQIGDRQPMTQGNGQSETVFTGAGVVDAAGALMGAAIRLRTSAPDGSPARSWGAVVIVLASENSHYPAGKRSLLTLSREDAERFQLPSKLSAPMPVEIEVSGPGGAVLQIRALAIRVHDQPNMKTTLAVDPLLGVFHVDGPGSVWSWTVPQ